MFFDGFACKACGQMSLYELPEYRILSRVTSDCRPFRNGGRLLICRCCSAAQSPADDQWFDEIGEIYGSYYAYHQSGGLEQCVADAATGKLTPRSEVLVDRLLALDGVPQRGSVLDVGCGTGGTLRAFSERAGWELCGLELDDRNLRFLKPLNGFDTLYTCPAGDVPRQFSLITLVHALEHFPDPIAILQSLRQKLAPGGRLFAEVPDAAVNPFDYVIADHMMHFSAGTLALMLRRAGFRLDALSTDWVSKELSATAQPSSISPEEGPPDLLSPPAIAAGHVSWLSRILDTARAAASEGNTFGLFGSSIAATWLCGALGSDVSFFVDEDPNRIGRVHMDRPILSPQNAPSGSVVLLAMAPAAASRIAGRLIAAPFDMRLPPPLPVL